MQIDISNNNTVLLHTIAAQFTNACSCDISRQCVLYRAQRDSGIDQATGPPVTYAVPFHSAHHLRWSCSKSQVLFLCSKRWWTFGILFLGSISSIHHMASSAKAQSQTKKKICARTGYKYLTLYILVWKNESNTEQEWDINILHYIFLCEKCHYLHAEVKIVVDSWVEDSPVLRYIISSVSSSKSNSSLSRIKEKN